MIPRLETVLGLSAFAEQFVARKRRNEEREIDNDLEADLDKLWNEEIKTKLRKMAEECGTETAVDSVGAELVEKMGYSN